MNTLASATEGQYELHHACGISAPTCLSRFCLLMPVSEQMKKTVPMPTELQKNNTVLLKQDKNSLHLCCSKDAKHYLQYSNKPLTQLKPVYTDQL